MTIQILTCRPDGTQALEEKEVPDSYFSPVQEEPEPEQKEPDA